MAESIDDLLLNIDEALEAYGHPVADVQLIEEEMWHDLDELQKAGYIDTPEEAQAMFTEWRRLFRNERAWRRPA